MGRKADDTYKEFKNIYLTHSKGRGNGKGFAKFNIFYYSDDMTIKPKTDVIPRSEKVMHIQFEWIFVRFMVPLFKE